MADRGIPLMVYISEVEKQRLATICEKTERDQSKMVRFLINREYEALVQAGSVSVETVPGLKSGGNQEGYEPV